MKIGNLEDLFVHELKDIYSAENQLSKALPKMAENASAPDLRSAFEQHLEVTQQHIQRLENIFDQFGVSPKGAKCAGMHAIIKEGEDLIGDDADPAVLDAGLIAGAQKAEHYEMAVYGTARTYAQILGHHEAARLLELTLEEEKQADHMLTEIAKSHVNFEAREEGQFGRSDESDRDDSFM